MRDEIAAKLEEAGFEEARHHPGQFSAEINGVSVVYRGAELMKAWALWALDTVMVGTLAVDSSNVRRVGRHGPAIWDDGQWLPDPDAKGTLYVAFSGAQWYRYADVPVSVAFEAVVAESVGKYIHRHVKEVYDYEKVEYAILMFAWNPLVQRPPNAAADEEE